MRHTRLVIALLLFAGPANATHAQETGVEQLLGNPDPAIQAQIQKVIDALRGPGDPRSKVDAIKEAQTLKKLSDDTEILKQLAIFVVTTKLEEDSQVDIAGMVLYVLDFRPSVTIRALAPCLDSENRQLRDFAQLWFASHDNAPNIVSGMAAFEPVNYHDYLDYVRWKLDRGEEVPAGFIKYIYDRSPGRALLVFAYNNSRDVAAAQLQAIRKNVEARKRGEEPPAELHEIGQKLKETGQARLRERREIELAAHIVSNAIWLNQNKFDEQFQKALPEATDELTKLAKQDQWWARLYVAEIMRQHRELRQPDVLQQLSTDSNGLVSEAAKSAH